jgi:hypothetical protein
LQCLLTPNTTPSLGKFAIGLTRASYNVSRLIETMFHMYQIHDVNPPLFNPAGAYHGAATASLNANTPGTTTDGGTQIGTFLLDLQFLPKANMLLYNCYPM